MMPVLIWLNDFSQALGRRTLRLGLKAACQSELRPTAWRRKERKFLT